MEKLGISSVCTASSSVDTIEHNVWKHMIEPFHVQIGGIFETFVLVKIALFILLRISPVRILRSAIRQPFRRVVHRHKSRRCTHRRRFSPRWTVSSCVAGVGARGFERQISFGGGNQDCEGRNTEASSSTTPSKQFWLYWAKTIPTRSR